jgi:hypothetical protein
MWKIDFGPTWFWVLLGICAVCGFVTAIVFIVKAAIWLFTHVQIV